MISRENRGCDTRGITVGKTKRARLQAGGGGLGLMYCKTTFQLLFDFIKNQSLISNRVHLVEAYFAKNLSPRR
jgi:hypothetical protein